MIFNGYWDGRPFTISVKPNCLTISLDGPAEARVFSFDYAGRLWTAYLDEIAYRRGLDGRMIAKWRQPGNNRARRWLDRAEAAKVEAMCHQQTAALYQALTSGQMVMNAPLTELGHIGFQRVIAFDAERSETDARQYGEVYQPVGILPPDQYMAVVLQLTEGCSFNTCTFCSFYRGRTFHIKTPEQFRDHAQAVRAFLGEGLSLRRTIFLGDANALVVPTSRLLPLLDIVHEVYDVAALGGLFAFLDGFSGERKTLSDYRTLAERGLTRVYIGLESGHLPLLRFLKKPGTPQDAVQAVRTMKAAGVAVGVIILLGAGGQQYADAHVQDTITVLNAMALDNRDILYFSELIVDDDLPYARDAIQAGLIPLTSAERASQAERIEASLHFSRQGGKPPVSRYDIREFIY